MENGKSGALSFLSTWAFWILLSATMGICVEDYFAASCVLQRTVLLKGRRGSWCILGWVWGWHGYFSLDV